MRDRTAQTEPLTIGQQLVARWESVNSGWSEPADLAEAIDAAIAAERERCAAIAENWLGSDRLVAVSGKPGAEAGLKLVRAEAQQIATAIRARSNSNE